MVDRMWQGIRGVSDPIPVRAFNGIFKPDDEGFNLPDDVFTELTNFSANKYPAITTRKGYTVIGAYGSGSVLGMGAWKGKELHAVFSDGTWRKWDTVVWTILASGLNTAAEWTFCNFKGNLSGINLIGSNGIDAIKRYDGSTVQNLANAPSGGNFITTHSNRLYCAIGNSVRFSALNEADDWTTVDDAGEIAVDTPDGETINGLNAGNGHLTVFKPSSMHELYGKGPQSYSMDKVASDIGAVSNKSIIAYDETLPFISRDGIYRYSGGIRPRKDYSVPVQTIINNANKANIHKSVAGNDGASLYFGLPLDTSSQINCILQLDPIHQAWYTWDGISAMQMLRVGDYMYVGDATGRILRLGTDTDAGGAITATAVTKPFTADSLARKQHWFRLWVVATLAAGSTLQIFISGQPTGNSWIPLPIISTDTGIRYKEILVPINSIAAANSVRLKIVATGRVTIHEITRQLRQLPTRR
ncbi:hypothetical protein SAMN04487969_10649 [Paenibacillus algorifonticola]|uniref:Uncharacterized protein n=1 Tax=Paenibacillus algorifonticola TaxID=684063 RepID=A0A1I2D327_9BACL|nr:hypothetical protein [Paenibacillus algorifonticola]SFE74463.1 hypothetical protein SAMN04487969_10649 [Paenibacillus algorifonticola]